MGRQDKTSRAAGWDEDEDYDAMEFDDDYEDTGRDAERLPPDEARPPRQPVKARPLARRLIEQAWEQQELSKSLADFDDYVV